MKLAIYSDLHIEFAPFSPRPGLLDEVDLVILAGDILAPGNSVPGWARGAALFGDKPVVFVAGNHEFYGTHYQRQRELMRAEAERVGIHYLHKSEVVVDGMRFLGTTLWTDFELQILEGGLPTRDKKRAMSVADQSLNDYHCIRHGGEGARLQPAQTRQMHQQERDWLLRELRKPFSGPTVVVTHHAPHRRSVVERFRENWLSGCFASELPDEFFEIPKLWVHGHIHDSQDYTVGNCRVICNPRGYPRRIRTAFENEAFDDRLVAEV